MEAMLLAELDPETVIVDTYAGWKRKGYQVKKGETAVFKTSIWKPCKSKKKDNNDSTDATETVNTENADSSNSTYKHLILVPAAFFTYSQVEKSKKGGK
jgi:hypothetical protein